jgi:hypothetical protein
MVNIRPEILKAGMTDHEKRLFRSLWNKLDTCFFANVYAENGEFTHRVAEEMKAVLKRCLDAYPENQNIIQLTAKKFHEVVLQNWK